jgi:heptose I phosphotransferase
MITLADPSPASLAPPQPPVDTLWQRFWQGARRLRQRADWSDFLGAGWPDRIMELKVTDNFHVKQGRSTGRCVFRQGGGRLAVYLKRHYRLPAWQGWLALLWPNRGWSPAFREYRNLQWARQQGLPVAEPVAAGEYIGPWGRIRSFLAVEELTGMVPLHQAIPAAATRLEPACFLRWKRGLVAELARLVRELHARRAFHKDCYLCHFFIPEVDLIRLPTTWRGRVYLIDLHRLERHPWTWRIWQPKDLGQLLYSSDVVGVSARDRLRFWRYYLGDRRRRLINRFLGWCIRVKDWCYRRHNSRRKIARASMSPPKGMATHNGLST